MKKWIYYRIWMIGCRIQSIGGRLAQWGYFKYFPQHPDAPNNGGGPRDW